MIAQILLYASGIIVPLTGLFTLSYRKMGKTIIANDDEANSIKSRIDIFRQGLENKKQSDNLLSERINELSHLVNYNTIKIDQAEFDRVDSELAKTLEAQKNSQAKLAKLKIEAQPIVDELNRLRAIQEEKDRKAKLERDRIEAEARRKREAEEEEKRRIRRKKQEEEDDERRRRNSYSSSSSSSYDSGSSSSSSSYSGGGGDSSGGGSSSDW